MRRLKQHKNGHPVKNADNVPHRLLENGYYASIAFAFFGQAWGVTIPLLGFGALLHLLRAVFSHWEDLAWSAQRSTLTLSLSETD